MAEQTPEELKQSASFEKSRNIAAVVAATIAATKKIGGAIIKVAEDIVGMIFK